MAAPAWSEMRLKLWENADSAHQREVLDALPVLVFLERAGRLIFANLEARQLMGVADLEWVQRPVEEVIWGLFAGAAEPQTSLASSNGRPFHATLAAKGGRMIPLEGTYQVVHQDRREGVIVAQMSARDRASKPRMMEDVLACIPDAIAIVLGRNVLYTNPAFTRMFGFTTDEISGGNLRDFIVPETRQHENAMLDRLVEDRGIAAMDTVRATKSGELLDVAVQVAPLIISGAKAGYVLSYRDIGERKQVEGRLQQDATHDALTGLPNRVLFEDHLKLALNRQARRSDQRCGVILLDVDGFRKVNGTLGRAAGDHVLVAVATRLQGMLRPHDTAARLSEDDYAILVENISTPADLEAVCDRMLMEFEKPLQVLGSSVTLAVSLGAAMAAGDEIGVEGLLVNADSALRRAKQAGGPRFEIFDRRTDVVISVQEERERALRNVLARREFQFWYQPFFRLATGHVEGFEALLRWTHADGTVDSFRDLLPVAESTGLSISIGRDTLDTAWRQLRRWNQVIPENGLILTVNVTHRQFFHDNLAGLVQQFTKAGGADASQLTIEVSEKAINENPDRSLVILQRLADCGVRIAVDNFGATMGALHHLTRMPVDIVKLDPGLTNTSSPSTRNMAVLEAILHVAKASGVQTLAQGIETHAQFEFVHQMGCELGQGHLLSHPLDAARAEMLAGRSRGMVAPQA